MSYLSVHDLILRPLLFITKQKNEPLLTNCKHLLDITTFLLSLQDSNKSLGVISPKNIFFKKGKVKVFGIGLYQF